MITRRDTPAYARGSKLGIRFLIREIITLFVFQDEKAYDSAAYQKTVESSEIRGLCNPRTRLRLAKSKGFFDSADGS